MSEYFNYFNNVYCEKKSIYFVELCIFIYCRVNCMVGREILSLLNVEVFECTSKRFRILCKSAAETKH